jgi:hypothetical protein
MTNQQWSQYEPTSIKTSSSASCCTRDRRFACELSR